MRQSDFRQSAVGNRQSGASGDGTAHPASDCRLPTADCRSSRWSERKRRTFARLAPAAVCIAGTEGPVPRTFGDNRGAWPIRVGITERAWVDLGPETDLALFEVEVYALAERLKIPARDDDALNKWLDWVLRKEMDRDERGR